MVLGGEYSYAGLERWRDLPKDMQAMNPVSGEVGT